MLAIFHLSLVARGLTTYLSFKTPLDDSVDLRGGDATGVIQCARSIHAVLTPFGNSSGYVRWRHAYRTTAENDQFVSEVEFASQAWSFRDLYDDVVQPPSSYPDTNEQLRPSDDEAASAAAQIAAFAEAGVSAAVAVAAQNEQTGQETETRAEKLDGVSDVEAPPHAPYPSHAGHTPTHSEEEDVADTAVDAKSTVGYTKTGDPATHLMPSTEELSKEVEEGQEDSQQDEARP